MSGRARIQGQAMVEYLVAAALLTALVALPIDGSRSVIELLLLCVQSGWERFLSALSLPV